MNLRPVKLYEGVPTPLAGKGPNEINFVCDDHLGLKESSKKVEKSVENVLRNGKVRTYDSGGSSSTSEMGEAIAKEVLSNTNQE